MRHGVWDVRVRGRLMHDPDTIVKELQAALARERELEAQCPGITAMLNEAFYGEFVMRMGLAGYEVDINAPRPSPFLEHPPQ